MNIAWVTPFNSRSAIAKVSAAVCECLAKHGQDVSIVRSERSPDGQIETTLPVYFGATRGAQEVLRHADAVVVNIGDNYEFHAGIFPCLEEHVCVGIFHDYYLYNLFFGWFTHHQHPDFAGDQVVKKVYGEDVLPLARAARRGEAALELIAQELPMTEWIAAQCGAAITHAEFYRSRLHDIPGSVRALKLSQTPRNIHPLPPRSSETEVVVLTVGLINPNKRADLVIQAIGSSPVLRDRCRYRLAGSISDSQRELLVKLAADAQVQLDVLGEVSDEVLQRELEHADIISCLRIPILEGASASAIEAMMSGRPVIVADAGFYAELPNDFVVKVPSNVDPASLSVVLERLVKDEVARRDMGDRARVWSRATFTVENYVSGVIPFLHEFVECKPYLQLGRSLGHQLVQLGLDADHPTIKTISERVMGLWPKSLS